jgi:hypothetical protein
MQHFIDDWLIPSRTVVTRMQERAFIIPESVLRKWIKRRSNYSTLFPPWTSRQDIYKPLLDSCCCYLFSLVLTGSSMP